MALYVPAGARRRRLVLIGFAGLVGGLVVGYVLGRSSAETVADRIASVRETAVAATTTLERLPIEYEQAVAGEGGESTDSVRTAIQSAETQVDDAFADATWTTPEDRTATDDAFTDLQEAVDDGVAPDVFTARIAAAADAVEQTFGLSS
jgi:hypothetical protein